MTDITPHRASSTSGSSTTSVPTLRLATFNAERGFWNPDDGTYDLDSVVANVALAPPDILGFSESLHYHLHGQRTLRRLANMLSELAGGARFEPYLAAFDGQANHPILLVNTSVVEVTEWWAPHEPHTRQGLWGWMRATIHGVDTWISCQHWEGGLGRHKFVEHAAGMSTLGHRAAIALGDFNTTSGWDGEIDLDWHTATAAAGQTYKRLQKGHQVGDRWQVDTRALDYLRRECGWRDLGEVAHDPTPTTATHGSGLRIDRILLSAPFPGELVPGTYRVHEPATTTAMGTRGSRRATDSLTVSDHKVVSATVTMTAWSGDTSRVS